VEGALVDAACTFAT